jgi:hypothetical protein
VFLFSLQGSSFIYFLQWKTFHSTNRQKWNKMLKLWKSGSFFSSEYFMDLKICTISVNQFYFYIHIQWKFTNLPHHLTHIWLFWNYIYDIKEWQFLVGCYCKTILHWQCIPIKLIFYFLGVNILTNVKIYICNFYISKINFFNHETNIPLRISNAWNEMGLWLNSFFFFFLQFVFFMKS